MSIDARDIAVLRDMHPPTLRWIAIVVMALCASAGAEQSFPRHWGHPPAIQTRDMLPLPGGYGHGSSTLAHWIQQNLDRDAAGKSAPRDSLVRVKGELRQGSRITFALEGPSADGVARDYRVSVRFIHRSGAPVRTVRAAQEKSATSPRGERRWLVEFTPDQAGEWHYRVSFLEAKAGESGKKEVAVPRYHGRSGSIAIAPPAGEK